MTSPIENPFADSEDVSVDPSVETGEAGMEHEPQSLEALAIEADMNAALARQEILQSFFDENGREFDGENPDDQETAEALRQIEKGRLELQHDIDEARGGEVDPGKIESAAAFAEEADAGLKEEIQDAGEEQESGGIRKMRDAVKLGILFSVLGASPMAAQAGSLKDHVGDSVSGGIQDAAARASADTQNRAHTASQIQRETFGYELRKDRLSYSLGKREETLQRSWERRKENLELRISRKREDLLRSGISEDQLDGTKAMIDLRRQLEDLVLASERASKDFETTADNHWENAEFRHQERIKGTIFRYVQETADTRRQIQVRRDQHNIHRNAAVLERGVDKLLRKKK